MAELDDVETFTWKNRPPGLLTKKEMEQKRLRLADGQKAGGKVFWKEAKRWVLLWREEDCQPKAELTPARIASIEKMQAAKTEKCTCIDCQLRLPSSSYLTHGRCTSCHNDYLFKEKRRTDRDDAILKARAMLEDLDGWVILDTETTGVHYHDQIVDIAVLSPRGEVLLDTRVKPTIAIPIEAQRIHGISNEMVADAPPFEDIHKGLWDATAGRVIVAYNEAFDHGMIDRRCLDSGRLNVLPSKWHCAMLQYAAFVNEWTSYFGGGYRWQKLPAAEHGALADCRATLKLIHKMAEARLSTEEDLTPVQLTLTTLTN